MIDLKGEGLSGLVSLCYYCVSITGGVYVSVPVITCIVSGVV